MKAKLLSAVLILAFAAESFAATVWWQGTESTDLAMLANWKDSADPTLAANAMGFGQNPSTDYTVTLADDLVSQGTWAFTSDGDPYRVTFDLGGHTLTYLKSYAANTHSKATAVIQNGTVAFTNATGGRLTVNFWHNSNSGFTMNIGEKGKFIGVLQFTDAGSRYLNVMDGGVLQGAFQPRGNCVSILTGEGSMYDALGSGRTVVGGSGASRLFVLDGAAMTNLDEVYIGGLKGYTASGNSYLCVSNATFSKTTYSAFTLGAYTSGSRMDIIDGSTARIDTTSSSGNANFAIGDMYGHSNLLYIAGAGTLFTNDVVKRSQASDGPMMVGESGLCNQLRVTDSAKAYIYALSAGGQRKSFGNSCVTSLWNRVTVDGGATRVRQAVHPPESSTSKGFATAS